LPRLDYQEEFVTEDGFPSSTTFYEQTTPKGRPFHLPGVLAGTGILAFHYLWPCQIALVGEACPGHTHHAPRRKPCPVLVFEFFLGILNAWRVGFWRTLREATRVLGIGINGVHRLHAYFAQNKYQDFIAHGLNGYKARRRVSKHHGHARIDVTYKYVPKGVHASDNF
jgi:hypothetical protein